MSDRTEHVALYQRRRDGSEFRISCGGCDHVESGPDIDVVRRAWNAHLPGSVLWLSDGEGGWVEGPRAPSSFAEMVASDPLLAPLVEAGIVDPDQITEHTRRVPGEADVTFADVPLSHPVTLRYFEPDEDERVDDGFCCSNNPQGPGFCDRHKRALASVRSDPGVPLAYFDSGLTAEHGRAPGCVTLTRFDQTCPGCGAGYVQVRPSVPSSGTEHSDFRMRPQPRRPSPMAVDCCGRSEDDPRPHGLGLCWGPRWIGRLRRKR